MNNLLNAGMLSVFLGVTAVPLFAQTNDFAVTIQASIDQAEPAVRIAMGQTVSYLVRWTDTGGADRATPVLEVDVDGVVTDVSRALGVSCTGSDPVRCTFTEPLLDQGGVWIYARFDTPGLHTTTARVSRTDGAPDANPANDIAMHTLEALALPSVTVYPSIALPPLEPGFSATFSVTLRNRSLTPATNVSLSVSLPAGGTMIGGDARFGGAGCTIQNNVLVCSRPSLAKEDDLQIIVDVTAPSRMDGQDLVIEMVETQTEVDLDPSDNQRTVRATMVHQFVVANVDDEGAGSLRQAIHDVNALCSRDKPCEILFRIPPPVPASGWFTIQPRTPLPEIAAWLKIDGRTQNTLTGNTNPDGPEIEINGALVSEQSGLRVRPSCRVEVRDLVVNGFPGYGIEVRGVESCATDFTEVRIWENYLGTDPRGRTAKPNQRGLGVFTFESYVYGNLISGNHRSGIYIEGGAYHQIIGNRIGATADLQGALGNGCGIFINMGNQFESFIGADISHNVIAYNNGMAIARTRRGEILISNNSIFDNLQQGIDIGIDGMTPQRADDTDVPNAPVLFGASYDAARNVTVVRGRIDSEAYGSSGASGQPPRSIEVFASARLSIWAEPQAEASVAMASPLTGHETFDIVVPGDLRGKWITATYTVAHSLGQVRYDLRGPASESHREGSPADTSELSNAVMAQ